VVQVYLGRMPFLLPSEECQNIERNSDPNLALFFFIHHQIGVVAWWGVAPNYTGLQYQYPEKVHSVYLCVHM